MSSPTGAHGEADATKQENEQQPQSTASTDATLNARAKSSNGAKSQGPKKWLIALIAVIAVVAVIVAIAVTRGKNDDANTSGVTKADTVTIGLKLAPVSLDIRHQSGSAIEQVLIGNVYEALLSRDSDNKVQPGLAKSWDISKDGKTYTIDSKAVVVAAGGFGANQEMLVKYKPMLKGYATTNHPGATGDGIVMAEKIGAATVDMDQIQAHPTATPEGVLISESVRGDGAILVNAEGKRFTNELLTRDVVSANELKQPGKFAWIIWDDGIRAKAKLIQGYIKMGLAVTGKDVKELAAATNLPADALEATLKQYAADQKAGKDSQFGRPDMPSALDKAPYWAVKVQPAVHHTMGGLKINTKAQVLNKEGKAIPGLFAAGEVTGGVHGGNRLGGNAQADIVTFGRIAGQSAAAYVK